MNRDIVTGKQVRNTVLARLLGAVRRQWNGAGAGAGGMYGRARKGTGNKAVTSIVPGGRKRVGEGFRWGGGHLPAPSKVRCAYDERRGMCGGGIFIVPEERAGSYEITQYVCWLRPGYVIPSVVQRHPRQSRARPPCRGFWRHVLKVFKLCGDSPDGGHCKALPQQPDLCGSASYRCPCCAPCRHFPPQAACLAVQATPCVHHHRRECGPHRIA